MSYELRVDQSGVVVCELGVIEYPWPRTVPGTRDVARIGPLIVLDGVTMCGLEEWEWLYESMGFDLHLTTTDDGTRRYLHIHAGNGTWTYELFDAHWRDGPPEWAYEAGTLLGRWPD